VAGFGVITMPVRTAKTEIPERRCVVEKVKRCILAGLVGAVLILVSGTAHAEDISGVIVRTLILSEHTRLVGDVTCTVTGAPCIAFGAPSIELRLNGFTMTGQADPTNGCSGSVTQGEMGISSNGQNHVEIRGPGVVQRFRADGVFFIRSVGGKVEGITVTTNCQSGIRVNPTSSRIRVESNVSVRNGNSQPGFACGGI
jgi:hypothetical protein